MELADLHKRLSDWPLIPAVPEKVRVQFETAKDLMLYTWFVFEFQTVAEMQAYLSLELALRERLANPTRTQKTRKGPKLVPLTLAALLSQAKSKGLIVPEKLPSWEWVKCIRERRARDYGETLLPFSAAEWFQNVSAYLPHSRNHLAHGNRKLHFPDSFKQLELCGDLINALFSTQSRAQAIP